MEGDFSLDLAQRPISYVVTGLSLGLYPCLKRKVGMDILLFSEIEECSCPQNKKNTGEKNSHKQYL